MVQVPNCPPQHTMHCRGSTSRASLCLPASACTTGPTTGPVHLLPNLQILLLHGFHEEEAFTAEYSFMEAGGVGVLVQLATQDWPPAADFASSPSPLDKVCRLGPAMCHSIRRVAVSALSELVNHVEYKEVRQGQVEQGPVSHGQLPDGAVGSESIRRLLAC